jgi:hypothetical protein
MPERCPGRSLPVDGGFPPIDDTGRADHSSPLGKRGFRTRAFMARKLQ